MTAVSVLMKKPLISTDKSAIVSTDHFPGRVYKNESKISQKFLDVLYERLLISVQKYSINDNLKLSSPLLWKIIFNLESIYNKFHLSILSHVKWLLAFYDIHMFHLQYEYSSA